jgi:hypothetical protein
VKGRCKGEGNDKRTYKLRRWGKQHVRKDVMRQRYEKDKEIEESIPHISEGLCASSNVTAGKNCDNRANS